MRICAAAHSADATTVHNRAWVDPDTRALADDHLHSRSFSRPLTRTHGCTHSRADNRPNGGVGRRGRPDRNA